MKPIRRMALTLFALSVLMLAAALYAARPVCSCVIGGHDRDEATYSDPADCAVHGATFEE